ncbi:hypothetical protein [Leifsonia sp. fls2-241-R2A-40a]|uniref:hypothetical protein n=1 Tax=Leifsonia sp. fls2-241-R2A-40a TaxID=3040290 RepID=UPI002550A8CA|nr:hypothetical protein [Leifsonia sp. fls2-241-R2A-40a]
MPRRTRTAIIATSIAVVVLAAVGVGGWALLDSMNGSFRIGAGKPAAAAVETHTATSTPTVVPVGGVLDEETALELRREMPDNGDFAYKTPDGRWIKTNRHQPMPAEVMAAEQAQLDQLAVPAGTAAADGLAGAKAATAAAGASSYRTGRHVLLISKIPVATSYSTNGLKWVIMGGLEKSLPAGVGGNGWDDEATAVAKAQELIAAQPDAGDWDIVVAQQG